VAEDAQDHVIELENDANYLINPGSVGQPRDGDPRAAYAVYQPETRLVTLFRAEYDVAAAQKKILKAGLPELLAMRLEAGV
jgi:diadenosine tetraphosphatase ApaH/serine/threonine PP2A family protein phosphatase